MPDQHVAGDSDCIASIAFHYGFFPDTVWNHAGNAALRQQRDNPNVLSPGDVVVIPDKRPKEVTRPDHARHRFRRKGVPEKLRFRLMDGTQPRANLPYEMAINATVVKGKTDGHGYLEHFVPPDVESCRLTIEPGIEEYEIQVRHLRPVKEEAGVRARLINLGFLDDNAAPDALESALKTFQSSQKLELTGKADAQTCDALVKAHGS